ncbi:hypothetical protein KPG71_10155 [Roseovarius sp. PS-C2]|uniref:hypothetical protein n=1 Tax=Roseovarius sp. PS-C2 TaxID=2820814 RepID=UPI001C0DC586|nr:hypothetical protein [Roseovarius sp. PS-C2]MBU3260375.1 hypothetical protein [Roseovarius sp. PS-C2]
MPWLPAGQQVRNNGQGEADAGGDFRTRGVTRVYDTGSTQVLVSAGLEPGQRVITHPSDAIADGVAITEREAQ